MYVYLCCTFVGLGISIGWQKPNYTLKCFCTRSLFIIYTSWSLYLFIIGLLHCVTFICSWTRVSPRSLFEMCHCSQTAERHRRLLSISLTGAGNGQSSTFKWHFCCFAKYGQWEGISEKERAVISVLHSPRRRSPSSLLTCTLSHTAGQQHSLYSPLTGSLLFLAAEQPASDVSAAQCVETWWIVLCSIIQKGYDNRSTFGGFEKQKYTYRAKGRILPL